MKESSLLIAIFICSFFSSLTFAQESPKPEDADLKLTIDKIDPSRFYNVAVIQGLNKTTAKTSVLEMRIGDKIHFGQISIIAHKCWQAPLDQKPESKILLEVFENKNGESENRIFYGWMFASSPSLSGLEHPIYDLTALSCKNK
jgi:hypothetical protein